MCTDLFERNKMNLILKTRLSEQNLNVINNTATLASRAYSINTTCKIEGKTKVKSFQFPFHTFYNGNFIIQRKQQQL